MKIVVQRVTSAKVEANNKVEGQIESGLLLLVGFTINDNQNTINYMINKILNLRIFDDENHVMNLSVQDIKGSILSISQFTLYANAQKGNRPSYIDALNNKDAKILYELFNKELEKHIKVEQGIFKADMKVTLTNDGPVTIILEK